MKYFRHLKQALMKKVSKGRKNKKAKPSELSSDDKSVNHGDDILWRLLAIKARD